MLHKRWLQALSRAGRQEPLHRIAIHRVGDRDHIHRTSMLRKDRGADYSVGVCERSHRTNTMRSREVP